MDCCNIAVYLELPAISTLCVPAALMSVSLAVLLGECRSWASGQPILALSLALSALATVHAPAGERDLRITADLVPVRQELLVRA